MKMKRRLSVLMVLAVFLSFTMATTLEVSAASGGKYYLPTRVKEYHNFEGKWKKTGDYKYTYDNKGNLKKWNGFALTLKYKRGKLSTVTSKGNAAIYPGKSEKGAFKTKKSFNAKGRIITSLCERSSKNFKYTMKNTYSYNKKGYISRRNYVCNEYDKKTGKKTDDTYKETVSYSYKYHKNGLPKQITQTYKSGSYTEKYVEKYNKQGLRTSYKVYSKGKLIDSATIKTTKKSGKVTSIVVSGTSKADGESYKYKTKYVFSYGKAKTKTLKKQVSAIGMMSGASIAQVIGDNPIVGYVYYTAF